MASDAAPVRAVVFDFDGTLAHLTIDFDLMRRRAEACAHDAGLDVAAWEGLHTLEMVDRAARRLSTDEALTLRSRCEAAIQSVELEAAAQAALFPGTREALATLRGAGLALAVITRNCRAAVLTAAPDLLDHIAVLVARDDAIEVKPDPRHVHQCLEELGLPGAPAALVGDHTMDMETARAGGWLALGVTCGAASAAQLRAAGADRVFPSVVEVARFLA